MTTTVAEVLTESLTDGLLELTLDRPEAMNSLNLHLKQRLAETLHRARYDDDVRAVLITGGGRAFCAGGDLAEMDPNRTPEQARARQHKLLSEVIVPLAKLPKPTVAAVNGHAHGAGLSLALACDVVIAGEDVPMSLGFVLRGLAADCGISYFLPRLIGMAKAKELLFTGRRFTGAEAAQLGLIAHAAPASDVLSAARETAGTFARSATVALALTKKLLESATYQGLEDLVEIEAYSQAITRSTGDHAEGIAAFNERRDAVFTGA
jgi:2-(1,2-epoxy-1,2-dihydrophenyl)acetyl-CoA isomerase